MILVTYEMAKAGIGGFSCGNRFMDGMAVSESWQRIRGAEVDEKAWISELYDKIEEELRLLKSL